MRATRGGFLGLTLTLLAVLALAGCSKSGQNSAQPNFTQQSGSSSAPTANSGSSSAPNGNSQPSSAPYSAAEQSPAPRSSSSYSAPRPYSQPAPQPVSITVPAGTDLHVVLDHSISSATAHSGDSFSATLVEPVRVRGQNVIPRNARVIGHVVEARSSGRLSREALLVLTLDEVQIGGRPYHIRTGSIARSGASHKKRDIIAIGGGTALGAIIGGIAGGGKGAAIGAAAGAGAGTAGAAITGKKNIDLPAEYALAFRLHAPLVVQQ